MKIRRGFISNSSSSSFILASDRPLEDITVTVSMKLDTIVEDQLKTKRELDNFILDEYDWRGERTLEEVLASDDELKAIYEKMTQLINEGKTILVGVVSSEDDNALSAIIYNEGFGETDGDFEIIRDTR